MHLRPSLQGAVNLEATKVMCSMQGRVLLWAKASGPYTVPYLALGGTVFPTTSRWKCTRAPPCTPRAPRKGPTSAPQPRSRT